MGPGPQQMRWKAAVAVAAVVTAAVVFVGASDAATGIDVDFGPGRATEGWTAEDGRPRQCGARGVHPDPVLDSFCHAQTRYAVVDGTWVAEDSPATWSTAIADGTYEVTVTVGESRSHPDDVRHSVQVESVAVHDRAVTTRAEPFLTASRVVTVTDGRLDVTFDGGTKTKIVTLSARSVAAPSTTTTGDHGTATTSPPGPPVALPSEAAIQAELETGLAQLGPGTHVIDDPLVLGSNTALRGAGPGVTILVPGSGYDPTEGPLIRTASADGAGNDHFHLSGFTVDCLDRCAGIAVHGYRYSVTDVTVIRAAGTGFATSWDASAAPGPSDGPFEPANEAWVARLQVQQSGSPTAAPVVIAGPHDMVFTDLFVSSHRFVAEEDLRPAAVEVRDGAMGTMLDRLHFWGRDHRRGLVVAPGVTGVRATNGYFEGARLEQILLGGDNNGAIVDGRIQCFPDFAPDASGLTISGAASTGHLVSVQAINCHGGAIVFDAGSAGGSVIEVAAWRSPLVGTPAPTASITATEP